MHAEVAVDQEGDRLVNDILLLRLECNLPDHVDFGEEGGIDFHFEGWIIILLNDLILFLIVAIIAGVAPSHILLLLLGWGNLNQLALLQVLRCEVHLEEVEAHDGKECQVEALVVDEFTEELADLFKVEDGRGGGLGLAGRVAPDEELVEVALHWRLSQEVVYDLELCLRNLEVRVHSKLL